MSRLTKHTAVGRELVPMRYALESCLNLAALAAGQCDEDTAGFFGGRQRAVARHMWNGNTMKLTTASTMGDQCVRLAVEPLQQPEWSACAFCELRASAPALPVQHETAAFTVAPSTMDERWMLAVGVLRGATHTGIGRARRTPLVLVAESTDTGRVTPRNASRWVDAERNAGLTIALRSRLTDEPLAVRRRVIGQVPEKAEPVAGGELQSIAGGVLTEAAFSEIKSRKFDCAPILKAAFAWKTMGIIAGDTSWLHQAGRDGLPMPAAARADRDGRHGSGWRSNQTVPDRMARHQTTLVETALACVVFDHRRGFDQARGPGGGGPALAGGGKVPMVPTGAKILSYG